MYKQLWPVNTFIGDISNKFDEEDRKGLIETGKKYVEKYPHTFDVLDPKITLPAYNLFNDPCKYVQKYKKILLEKVLNLARLEEHPYIDDVEVEAILLARRFSGNGSGQTPHYHRGVDYTSIFYADLDNINTEFIQNVINDYDAISESCEYAFPSHIRIKIKKQYETKLSLPSSLVVDITECKSDCCVSVKV